MPGVRPYSTDRRERVLAAVDRGARRAEVCAAFAVSEPTITRWLRRRRETGGVEPTPDPGRPAPKADALRSWLPARLEARPDATLEELAAAFADEHDGVAASTATISRAIAAVGWTRKKRASPPPSATRRSEPASGRRWPASTPTAWSSSTRPAPTSP